MYFHRSYIKSLKSLYKNNPPFSIKQKMFFSAYEFVHIKSVLENIKKYRQSVIGAEHSLGKHTFVNRTTARNS